MVNHLLMNDLNRSGTSIPGGTLDFGYKLYVHIRKVFFGGILTGFVTAVCSYPFLAIHNTSTWRPYFFYLPLAVGMGFALLAFLVLSIVCPREKQVNFESVLTSVERWRALDIRNKVRLLIGALFSSVFGLVVGWIVGGWTSFIFR